MLKTIVYSLFLCCLCPLSLLAQQEISGQLFDENHSPLAYATTILYSPDTAHIVKGEVSNELGVFTFPQIHVGKYLLKISSIGYRDLYRALEVQQQDIALKELQLSPNTALLAEVTVSAKKPIYERKADRTVINVQNSVSSAGASALEILERAPGVSVDRVNNGIALMGKNGVTVYINGKRSRLEADALVQMLAATPEGNIESIELITNPPASFDADGDGGVIHIILRQSEERGFNGEVNAFGGYGERGKFGGGGHFNWKQSRFNLYGNFSSNNDYTNQNIHLKTKIQYPNQLIYTEQNNRRPPYLGMHSAKLGMDVDLTTKTRYGFFAAASKRVWKMKAEALTDYLEKKEDIQQEVLSSVESNITDHYMLSNRLEHEWSRQQKISFDYDYLNYKIINPTDYQSKAFGENAQALASSNFSSSKETPFDFHVIKTDYEVPINALHQIQAGAKTTLARVNNQTQLRRQEPFPQNDPQFTDDIQMQENIYAAYLSARGSFQDKWSYSAGLRYEYAQTNLSSERDGPLIGRRLGRFFPSISISQQFSENNKLALSYAERINRPGFQTLAPAFYFFDANTILAGNINTLPSISRSISADLSLGTLILSLAYTDIENPISWGQPQLNQEQNILLLSPRNIDGRELLALSLSFPLPITSFWTSRYNLSGFWGKEVPYLGEQTLELTQTYGLANMTQTFSFAKSWEAELTSRWNSKIKNGVAVFKPRLSFNLGLQKQFPNQSKLSLSWTDLFNNGSFFGLYADQPAAGIAYDWTYQIEGNIFRLSYSIPFGNRQLKTTTPRKSGSEEVQQRANN